MNATVTLNTKLTPDEKQKFVETAEALGLSSSSALKVLIRTFNKVGDFLSKYAALRQLTFNARIRSVRK